MKIAIAGGRTGGHLFPALAVGEVLLERGHEVLLFISEKEIDALAVQGRSEFRFEKLPSIGMPRVFSPAMFTFFQRFLAGLASCRRIFADFKPDAVLGMGGFTSTAPILAGKLRRVPTFLHESNAIPGKANRLNACLVDAVLLGFEECRRHFPRVRCEVTGTPLRRSLDRRVPREEALAGLGLQPDGKTVLVMGGSQGAHGINAAMQAAAAGGKLDGLQVIHLTGAGDEAATAQSYRAAGVAAHVAAFCRRMEDAYSAADLVVARSGAASLSEISHFGLPALLIPYPHAAENHQQLNAEIFARAGAAKLLEESATTGETLAAAIRKLTEDPELLHIMAVHSRSLAPRDAAACVADALEKFT